MSPRRIVVVENSALRRFMIKHGYCVSAAWLAGALEAEIKSMPPQVADAKSLRCGGLRVEIKRRNDQWFVTDIEIEEV